MRQLTRLGGAKIALFLVLGAASLQMMLIALNSAGIGTHAQEVLELSGQWSMWLLVAVLAIRPAQQIYGFSMLLRFRRMVGLYAAWYGLIHTVAYLFANEFQWGFVINEILIHPFLSTGTAALVLLIPLAVTSTDGMVRRLGGRRWRLLQRIVYAVLVIAVIHYILEVRLSPSEPILQAGLIGWLLHYRVIVYWRRRHGRPVALGTGTLLWSGLIWVLLTAGMELLFFHVNTGVRLTAVLQSYLQPAGGLRPASVAAVVLLIVIIARTAKLKYDSRQR